MSGVATVAAQAKINLALRVHSRDGSGYHAIETLFARIDLADDVVVRATSGGRSLDCRGAAWTEQIPAERNLAYRAALAYAESGWPSGFAIEIDKRIPAGGGLGGGSADAGAVLRALNALNPRPVTEPRLLELAAMLGADVPFLASDIPLAVGSGYGEKLLPLSPLPVAELRLCLPNFGVATAEAYGWLDHDRATSATSATSARASRRSLAEVPSWAVVAAVAENDFEPVVSARHPEIAGYVRALRDAGADVALMSGSGSTVFGVWYSGPCVLRTEAIVGATVIATRTSSRVEPVALAD
ncbi:MAG: 4-(cytidine 5'-diphospho)-2-C-methyl-D-erythritol kinase [Gemmatimonadota bacterium]|nr:4-(cytidine 5'-diphospho)-2-C-methyl-D-erythritol kinase [Gemmatimonadota bacterium]